jgi:hypothetical protein
MFAYPNKNGHLYMATAKSHIVQHTPENVAHYGDAINVFCEAPEITQKDLVKEQDDCTTHAPHVQSELLVMARLHSLRNRREFIAV